MHIDAMRLLWALSSSSISGLHRSPKRRASFSLLLSSCYCYVYLFQSFPQPSHTHLFHQRSARFSSTARQSVNVLDYFDDYKNKNVLILGDGDFSFARDLSDSKVCRKLIATTIDSAELMKKFPKFNENKEKILMNGDQILYEIDATKLSLPERFDIITWNFPHRLGKQNIRYNREIIRNFLLSAREWLSPDGKILLALCRKQSGFGAISREDWDFSWQLPVHAADANLLLTRESYFPLEWPTYSPTGRRGVARNFFVEDPRLYTLMAPSTDGNSVRRAIQAPLYSFELPLTSLELVDLNLFFPRVLHELQCLLEGHGLHEYFWSADLVECYIQPPDYRVINYRIEVCLVHLSKSLTREFAHEIRNLVQEKLHKLLGMG